MKLSFLWLTIFVSLQITSVCSFVAPPIAPAAYRICEHHSKHQSSSSRLFEKSVADKTTKQQQSQPSDSYDVIVVGSGIGGLSCAAMLSTYGYSVAVLESHSVPGGAAHGFTMRAPNSSKDGQFIFDTGPSFFSGLAPDLPAKASNPLRTILDAIGERVECEAYSSFGLVLPEGNFVHTPDFGKPGGVVDQVVGSSSTSGSDSASDSSRAEGGDGVQQWQAVMRAMAPLARVVDALPTAALRQDVGVALTAAPYLPLFATLNPLENFKLTKPFQSILTNQVKLPPSGFVQNWLDLLCFCLSGLPADGTITAEMALMLGEFYDDDAVMDCPKGGAKSIVDALVRGIEKKEGNAVFTKSRVDKILVQDGRATGVQLGDRTIRATKAVVSNLSVWDLFGSGILDEDALSSSSSNDGKSSFVQKKMDTPVGKSFMHLHIGFRATREELQQLQAHYMFMEDWERGVDADENAVLLSIPSVHDDSLAPAGHGVLHIYTPATEDYARWEGLDRKSAAYKALKDERSQYLWQALEKVIPDIRDRTVVSRVGTPLTHQRFLNRYRGSYGPAIRAGEGSFPFPKTPIEGLLVCGDSCFPGIGVPAVAGSGLLTANSVSFDSIKPQLNFLEKMRSDAALPK